MPKLLQRFLFAAILMLGVASLLATAPRPVADLVVTTLNNFGNSYGDDLVYACSGEQIDLSWSAFAGTLELSARPADSVSPPLTSREVASEGQLEVTALDDATLKITSNDGNPDEAVDLKILPETLCTDFNFPLVGWYTGTLSQSEPTTETLPRELRLYIRERDTSQLTLMIDTDTDFYFYEYNESLPTCEVEVATATLRCSGEEGQSIQQFIQSEGDGTGSSFELSAQITARGLVGRYSGISKNVNSVVPFSGTLTFEKQAGTPPPEAQP